MILIGAEPQPPYERPPLSKAYLRGEVPFDKALVRPAAFYAEHGIQTMFGTRATRIDPSARVVELEDHRRVSFDALLIATGGRNRTVSIPGVDLDGIYSLRTVQDADRIRAEMIAGRRAVVVGMGFIGSALVRNEMVGSQSARCAITSRMVKRAGSGRRSKSASVAPWRRRSITSGVASKPWIGRSKT